MSDTLIRVAVVVAVTAAALAIGFLLRRWQWSSHPPIDASQLALPAGIVVFTSTECANCKKVLATLRGLDVPMREVTHELEPESFEAAGVEAVPLTVVIDNDGSVAAQLPGVVSARRVKRSLRSAGVAVAAG
jgi:hypothetical protein